MAGRFSSRQRTTCSFAAWLTELRYTVLTVSSCTILLDVWRVGAWDHQRGLRSQGTRHMHSSARPLAVDQPVCFASSFLLARQGIACFTRIPHSNTRISDRCCAAFTLAEQQHTSVCVIQLLLGGSTSILHFEASSGKLLAASSLFSCHAGIPDTQNDWHGGWLRATQVNGKLHLGPRPFLASQRLMPRPEA